MSKKSGSGLEQYIDKIVLGIAGLISLYVLIFYVLKSPTTIEYGGNSYSPGDVDKAIREQARLIEDRLAKKATEENQYQSKLPDFKSMLASPIKGIDGNTYFPLPYAGAAENGTRVYDIPQVCDVNDVKARLMTAVAYVPKRPLESDDSYAAAETEPADIDLVTVEATISTPELCKRFAQSFGTAKNPAWAKPVFAAVQLERQELLKNGRWSDWQVVPRTKIDEFSNRFNVPSKVNKLDKSIEILMLQFDKPEIKTELLQPRTYDFAYPLESWLPPSLAEKRQGKLDKIKVDEQKRRRDEARKVDEDKAKTRATSRPSGQATGGGRAAPAGAPGGAGGIPGMGGGGGLGMPGGGGGGGGMALPTTRSAQPARTTPANRPRETTTDITRTTRSSAIKTGSMTEEQEFAKIGVAEKTDFATMKEPLLVWAHDDTTEPGKTYKYRMRLGVFDPAAGTNSFNDRDKALKDDVILWSNYSQVTGSVTIPARWYFFPLDYREADKMVNMHVCRYLLAKWYSKDFRVKPGEVIGAVVENVKNDSSGVNEPNEIDYSNGTVLVDVVPVLDKDYANALYALDTKTIEQLGVKQANWPADLKVKFAEIERLQKEPAPAFAGRTAAERSRSVEPQGMPGGRPGMGMPGPGGMPGMGMPGPGGMPGMP